MHNRVNLLFLLVLIHAAFGARLYMATNGTNSGDCRDEGRPCLSFKYIFPRMKGGDTLIIEDGVYTGTGDATDNDDRICQTNAPPSGTPDHFTVIRARNIPCQDGVPCDQPLRVRFSGNATFSATGEGMAPNYVKFWGIRWNGIATYTGWNHLYFKQVASQGIRDGNTTAIAIMGQYNLLEDVVAFGKGRYKIMFYDVSRDKQANGPGNNVCRRCIVRHDWSDRNDTTERTNIAGFCSYFNRGSAFLNCLVIDSDSPAYWSNSNTSLLELAGGFYKPIDPGPHNLTIKGTMVINCAYPFHSQDPGSGGPLSENPDTFENVVGAHLPGGFFKPININRLTLVDIGVDNFNYRSERQLRDMNVKNDGIDMGAYDGATTFSNFIMRNLRGVGVRGLSASDYACMYDIEGGAFSGTAIGHLDTSHDPFNNGLKYLPRIEAGSWLKTAGKNSGQLGAEIMKKLGKDGTFKYDPDWQSEQEDLWPWPLEDWVQAELRTSEWGPDPYRGFCARGTGLYGGPITLTSYIWEYLGNPCPKEICNYGGSIAARHNLTKEKDCCSGQNYINPVTRNAFIRYFLPEAASVKIEIYTPSGRLVRTLVNVHHAEGEYRTFPDGGNGKDRAVPNGLYLYRIETIGKKQQEKIALLR